MDDGRSKAFEKIEITVDELCRRRLRPLEAGPITPARSTTRTAAIDLRIGIEGTLPFARKARFVGAIRLIGLGKRLAPA